MLLTINRQENYSRGKLIIRTLFGIVYIFIPHYFLLFFVSVWNGILEIAKFWIALFTGEIPKYIFDFQKKMMQWKLRVSASFLNLIDDYPAIGMNASNANVHIEFEKPEKISRSSVLLRGLFGFIYVGIPHGLFLFAIMACVEVIALLAWWIVLITGKYPEALFNFIVWSHQWYFRVVLYLYYYTDKYPSFGG